MRTRWATVLAVWTLTASAARAQPTVLYVNGSLTTGANNGTSWANAYRGPEALQSALTAAPGVADPEVWIAAGTYKPSLKREPGVASTETFRLTSAVRLYGGFVGNETSLTQRDWFSNRSVLSGDLDGDDPSPNPSFANMGDNAYQVVTAEFPEPTGAIDGVWIVSGNAKGTAVIGKYYTNQGGGLFFTAPPGSGGMVVRNCTFTANSAVYGGGITNRYGALFTVENCRFLANRATGQGAGVYARHVNIYGSVFSGNIATQTADDRYGGGALSVAGVSRVVNCSFYGNSSYRGGAVFCFTDDGPQRIENCAFRNNSALIDGQAVFVSSPSVVLPIVTNCMFANYPADIAGQFVGAGSLSGNPAFFSPAAPSFDFRIPVSSPAIDAGNTSAVPGGLLTDLLGRPRLIDGDGDGQTRVDIGATECPRGVGFVNGGLQSGLNDGSSWANAHRGPNALQDAIAAAATDLERGELWVVKGVYKPDLPNGSRSKKFALRNHLAIYGGFDGDETQRSQRDPDLDRSTVSGDLNGDDTGGSNRGENSYHVVTGSQVGSSAVLDGFIIESGEATSGPDLRGGGVLLDQASPRITNCDLRLNNAAVGGALAAIQGQPLIASCTFQENQNGFLLRGASARFWDCDFLTNTSLSPGGAGAIDEACQPVFVRCRFIRNGASFGGAIHCNGAAGVPTPTFINCKFFGNVATGLPAGGGALWTSATDLRMYGCLLAGNLADGGGYGGGVVTDGATIVNSTLVANHASAAGGAGGMWLSGGTTTLLNCILWRNSGGPQQTLATQIAGPGNVAASHTTMYQLSPSGNGNNGTDPGFLVLPSPGADLQWGTPDDNYGDLHLGPASALIDSADSSLLPADIYDIDGDNDTIELLPHDLDGNPRLVDDPAANNTGPGPAPHVDRGPYENNLLTAVWTNPGGGSFANSANWLNGLLPNASARAVFDERVGSTQAQYEVTFPTAQSAYSTSILANQVTFNLSGFNANFTQAAPLVDPGTALLIGDTAGLPAGLTVRSSATSGAARALIFGNGIIAGSPNSSGSLILNSQRGSIVSSGVLDIGRAGAGSMSLSSGALGLTTVLRLGVQPGASGTLSIIGQAPLATELDYGDTSPATGGDNFIVGDAGTGQVTVSNLGALIGAAADRVVLGRLPASSGTVDLIGAGTIWDAIGNDFIIGESGSGILSISGGASLVTTISNELVLARNPGSSASVTIGTGSSWTSTRALTIAQIGGGTATLNIAGTLNVPGLSINPLGAMAGPGTVQTSGVVFNAGTIAPQGSGGGGTYGTLTIQGNYEQARPNIGGSASGELHLKVAGDTPGTTQDKFIVNGSAQFGGGLFISAPEDLSTPPGFSPQLISATTRTRNFDVAFFSRLTSNRFFKLTYPRDGSVYLGIGQLDGPINFGNPINSQTLRPSAIALGDIDNDGDPDLALAVPDTNPNNNGSIVILLNGGNTGSTWNGFVGQITILTGVGKNPQGIALGNFDGVDGSGGANRALDIAVANTGDHTLTIITNTGGGTVGSFAALTPFPTGPEPVGVAAGRLLLAPGTLDDVVVANSGPSGAEANTVTVLGNQGGLDFVRTPVPVGPRPTSTCIANLSGNGGQMDLISSNIGDNTVSVRIGTPQAPNLWTGLDMPTGSSPGLALSTDLNDDGLSEIITVDEGDGSVSVIVNTTAAGTVSFAPRVALPVGTTPISATAVDMDQDDDPDLAVVVDGEVKVLRNDLLNGQIAFAPAQSPPPGPGVPLIVDHADVNRDNREDLVTITTGPRNVGAFAGANPNQTQGSCYANCDGSTGTPALTPNDFQCFLNAYAAGQTSANCDGSTGTPALTPNDFQCFLNAYAAGCS